VNSSANDAGQGGSAFESYSHFNLSLHFCTFSRNSPANHLFVDWAVRNSDTSCVALTNNSCQSDSGYRGLIFVLSTLAMSSCVFQLNTFNYFLGAGSSSSGNITFANCVFDFQSLNKTHSVSFSTTDYTYNTQTNFLIGCRTWTPMPTRTHMKMRSPTQT
jgi:hypothetical protein